MIRDQSKLKISKTQAKKALLKSGYLLEYRLESLLREAGYYVEANAVYPDQITGKSRELDLYALAAEQFSREYDTLFNVLIMECMNNQQPVAFLTKEPLYDGMYLDSLKLAGLPVKVYLGGDEEAWESLRDHLNMQKFHHYCKGRIATQFCSFGRKKSTKDEWIAYHQEPHFDAFQKLCDAVEYYADEHFGSWVLEDDEKVNIEIYYPVVVVQGDLLDVHPTDKTITLKTSRHIRYCRTAFHDNEIENYTIDVVTEPYFPEFLSLIKDETQQIARRMKRHKETIRKSIDKIVHKAKRLRSHKKIREAMDL